MWLQLGNKYNPDWDGRPPQLLEQDNPTWQKYRKKIAADMKYILYNVAITMYPIPETATTEANKRLYMYPISKRIDAVGWDGTNWHLYEVNRNAKLRSIGQAIAYRDLWNEADTKYKQGKTNLTYIITEIIDDDVKYICSKERIILEQI